MDGKPGDLLLLLRQIRIKSSSMYLEPPSELARQLDLLKKDDFQVPLGNRIPVIRVLRGRRTFCSNASSIYHAYGRRPSVH